MPAPGGQRERAAVGTVADADREVHVGAGVEQQLQDPRAPAATDRPVQAALGVDVHAVRQEPAQPGGVLEVELVPDQALEAGNVQGVEEAEVRLLAGVVEGVLVGGGAVVEQQPEQDRVAAFDGVEEGGLPPLAARLDRVRVRVGAGVEQQARALPQVGGAPDAAPQQRQQRGQTPDRGGRRGPDRRPARGQRGGITEDQRPLDAVEGAALNPAGQVGPAREAVVVGQLVLGVRRAG